MQLYQYRMKRWYIPRLTLPIDSVVHRGQIRKVLHDNWHGDMQPCWMEEAMIFLHGIKFHSREERIPLFFMDGKSAFYLRRVFLQPYIFDTDNTNSLLTYYNLLPVVSLVSWNCSISTGITTAKDCVNPRIIEKVRVPTQHINQDHALSGVRGDWGGLQPIDQEAGTVCPLWS
jgi:hypothetical protein